MVIDANIASSIFIRIFRPVTEKIDAPGLLSLISEYFRHMIGHQLLLRRRHGLPMEFMLSLAFMLLLAFMLSLEFVLLLVFLQLLMSLASPIMLMME